MNDDSDLMESTRADQKRGYDPRFLDTPVALPQPADVGRLVELDYVHFTVLLDPGRRLAVATAVNIDGDRLVNVKRGDDWHLDPRVPEDQQAGPELYRNNDLDRGHLVRRRDPVWGISALAERANADTFAYTNAAPQASAFNQDKALWLALEDYLLEHARIHNLRLTVFTGPVFTRADPRYRGIQIPLAFWKVAVWIDDNDTLAATGYVVDQSPELDDIDLTEALRHPAQEAAVPPLGKFRTFQVPILDIEDATALDFGPATGADRLVESAVRPERSGWVRLEQLSDIII